MAHTEIIIPCYNEEHRLDVGAFRNFQSTAHDVRFLFVNDGSNDGTLKLLESLEALDGGKFAILNLQPNQGKAEAVRRGVLAALGSSPNYVGFWDADLATPLNAIPMFLDLAESRPELEIIMGARVKLLGRNIERRTSRHYLGRMFATAVSAALRLPVYDTQCGAKLFRVSPSLNGLFQEPFQSRWIFDVEILARLIQARRDKSLPQPEQVIYELPLLEWCDVPGSKVGPTDFVRAAWELARIRREYFSR